jgi:hypothetical protein
MIDSFSPRHLVSSYGCVIPWVSRYFLESFHLGFSLVLSYCCHYILMSVFGISAVLCVTSTPVVQSNVFFLSISWHHLCTFYFNSITHFWYFKALPNHSGQLMQWVIGLVMVYHICFIDLERYIVILLCFTYIQTTFLYIFFFHIIHLFIYLNFLHKYTYTSSY